MQVGSPTISPDERWLVFTQRLSNLESRLMIQALTGGEPRELVGTKGYHDRPTFTPRGDRIVFVSTLPRRDPTDYRMYLVSAPFDAQTGTLSGSPRQLSLEGVNGEPRVGTPLSPDGHSVAYVECCESRALKVIPVTGGNARTLIAQGSPRALAWSSDGRFVFYEVEESPQFVRMKVSRDGGAPTVVARSSERMGVLSPDNRYSYVNMQVGSNQRSLRLFRTDGTVLGEVPLPRSGLNFRGFAADGKYIVAIKSNAIAPIKVVPVAGGPIRQITRGDSYDWAWSWTDNSDAVYIETEEQGRQVLALVTPNGERRSTFWVPEDAAGFNFVGIEDGYLVHRAGDPRSSTGWRLMAMSLKDSSRRELAHNLVRAGCCEPVGAGGMYYAAVGGEFLFRQLSGNRLQVRSATVSGESRLIGEVPASLLGKTGFAVYQNRMVFTEATKDSVRLQLVAGPGRQPTTLGSFPKADPGEMAWSPDGRRLAVWVGNPPGSQKQLVYNLSVDGVPQGVPQVLNLPFEYWYNPFWLPDGSGLTMIAQPRGMAMTHVALVRLADPEHPILLTRDDPNSKWGYSLSPDGKFVAYPSEHLKGSSIYLMEVAELLKQVRAHK